MEKINGFFKEEVVRLVDFIESGKKSGKCLSALFEEYGDYYGRAKGSVRNFYYQLLKNRATNAAVEKLLDGRDLKAEKIVEFSTAETKDLIVSILKGKSRGKSVRSVIAEMSKGNDKLMLRLQNKYRNVLKTNPDMIESVMAELKDELGENYFKKQTEEQFSDFALKRLQKEINGLYNRLGESLKKDNRILKERVLRLENENMRLKALIEEETIKNNSRSKIFFERENVKKMPN